MYMPTVVPGGAMSKEPFSWRRSTPLLLVIAAHVAVLYGVAVNLNYIKLPFAPPTTTMVSVPTTPVDATPEKPVTVDKSLVAKQEEVTPDLPKIVIDTTTSDVPADTAPVVTQPPPSGATTPAVGVRLLQHPEPPYPPISRQQGEEGTVTVKVTITAQGQVADAELARSSGYPRLDDAAVKAVRTWRFSPYSRGNTTSMSSVLVPVKFQLNSRMR